MTVSKILFSEECWIDENYYDLFHSNQLGKFNDFIDKNLGKTIRVEPEKSIRFFHINHAGKKNGFYIKNVFPKWYRTVKKFFIYGTNIKISSSYELQLIRFYNFNNVPVVFPVACGVRRLFGIPVSGFLVQKEVKGEKFTKLVKNGSSSERIKLIKAYGKLIAELHSKGIISSVVRVTDLISPSSTDKNWNDISLIIIDREKGKLGKENLTIEKCVYYLSFILKRFKVYIDKPTTKEMCYFLKTYLEHLAIQAKPDFKHLYHLIICDDH